MTDQKAAGCKDLPRANSPWTQELSEAVLAAWRGGATGSQISRRFKVVSRSAVMGHIMRHGEQRRVVRPEKPVEEKKVREKKKNTRLEEHEPMNYKKNQSKQIALRSILKCREVLFAENLGVSLVDLKDGQCKWPMPEGNFCGGPTVARTAYCACHAKRAHVLRQRVFSK